MQAIAHLKTPQVLTIDALLAMPAHASRPIIDVRTPSEYDDDHLPGAVNHPVHGSDERVLIGTINRQAGAFEANIRGAALVSANIAAMLAGPFAAQPRDWNPVVYCWRGGSRSWSLATVLARIGWRTGLLEGGYRSYRQRIVAEIDRLVAGFRFVVVAGPTGTGKTRLLGRLGELGLQVLDLEGLANHRGSVLGGLPDSPQPSQKAFDGSLWRTLSRLDPLQPVLVESESRKIGQIHLPDALIGRMRAAECVVLELPVDLRVSLLREAYPHLERDGSPLAAKLQRLAPLYQDSRVGEWRALAAAGRWPQLVERLLVEHYDPAYRRSMMRNYQRIGEAPVFTVADASEAALSETARAVAGAIAGLGARAVRCPEPVSSPAASARSKSGP